MLELKNIIKDYKSGDTIVHALKDVSLQFRKNEFVCVLGPSGCGKTTLLNIVGGLDKYSSGDLLIGGVSTKEYKSKDWDVYRNHSVGFVFQSYNLIGHQSVLANVEMALTLSGVSKKERRERATKALEQVGLLDQLKKRPNQLSGGQMQRVSIARAIVNDPDIILADEPTGALDSETSVQVMELLKQISKKRLIIMVTHNADLADQYASRIVRLLDGQLIEDTNPLSKVEIKNIAKSNQKLIENIDVIPVKKTRKHKTSMSYVMALSLSFKNLMTKKARTILTAFAGSIGIIGIALILALSSGMTNYIDRLQSDTLSTYPLTIAQSSIDMKSLTEGSEDRKNMEKFPSEKQINVFNLSEQMTQLFKKNAITDDYVNNVIKKIDPSLYNAVQYSYNNEMHIYGKTTYEGNEIKVLVSKEGMSILGEDNPYADFFSFGAVWGELINNKTFLAEQYDVLEGRFPENKNEIIISVDEYNQISDVILSTLGIIEYGKSVESIPFDSVIGKEYKLLTNDQAYIQTGTGVDAKFNLINPLMMTEELFNDGVSLKVVGVVRANPETVTGSIQSTVGYLEELTTYLLDIEKDSEIVSWQKAYPTKNALNNGIDLAANEQADTYAANIAKLGGCATPKKISIYPVDFASKEAIKNILDAYNNDKEEEDKIYYTDIMSMVVSAMNTLINTIQIVLIAFTSISLVVSSIMIGIITYISVLERTKEIGILRAIGARKRDVSRIFNAETLIIGFGAGLLGVLLTYLLSIPINIVLKNLVDVNNVAALNPLHALILIAISMFLTFIAGLIPARIAAKKDPVVALRSNE